MPNLNIKKLVVTAAMAAITCGFNQLHAQRLVFLFAHGVYSAPAGSSFKDNYKGGGGAEAGVGVGLLGKTFITGTVGFTDFLHSSSNNNGNLTYVPIKAGIRHYLFARILYLHGDIGAGLFKENKIDHSATKVVGDLGVGLKLAAFEFQADYDGILGTNPSGSWFALKAGFNFGL